MATILAAVVEKGFDSITLRTNGELPKRIAGTLQRMAVMGLLRPFLSESVNVVNAFHLAEGRGIAIRSETMGQAVQRALQHSIELEITEKVDGETRTHTVIGTVFADNQPRVLGIKGYWMDMIPAGPMVLIVNKDRPGVIGLVGNTFGKLGVNIADMTISRKGEKALMLLKLDKLLLPPKPSPRLKADTARSRNRQSNQPATTGAVTSRRIKAKKHLNARWITGRVVFYVYKPNAARSVRTLAQPVITRPCAPHGHGLRPHFHSYYRPAPPPAKRPTLLQ